MRTDAGGSRGYQHYSWNYTRSSLEQRLKERCGLRENSKRAPTAPLFSSSHELAQFSPIETTQGHHFSCEPPDSHVQWQCAMLASSTLYYVQTKKKLIVILSARSEAATPQGFYKFFRWL